MSGHAVTSVMTAAPEELHIASVVVYAAPARGESVAAAVREVPEARLHGSTAGGKLVVTLEAGSAGEMTERIDSLRRIAGVLSVALVYQCADSLEAMNEEMP